MDWRKSSFSSAQGGSCVETASGNGVVLVRDTTDRAGAVIEFTPDAWKAFAMRIKGAA